MKDPEDSEMSDDVPPPVAMMGLVTGYWVSKMIRVAAKLGIADLLAGGPRSATDLAAATGVHADRLYRVLRTLASQGVFVEDEDGRFDLTPLAATLRRDVPGSVHGFAVMILEDANWEAWRELGWAVETGGVAFQKAVGMAPWEYLAAHPEDGQMFGEAMTSLSASQNPAIVEAYDFTGIGRLVDVGGGHGSLLAMILTAHPEMRGVLFDVPATIENARRDRHINTAAVAGRVDSVAGDFFDLLPTDADCYLMKYILHDWNDDDALRILQSVRRVATPGTKLLIVDAVVPPGNVANNAKMMDVNMMVIMGGLERTEPQFRDLLANAGFLLKRVIATECPLSIVEALPA